MRVKQIPGPGVSPGWTGEGEAIRSDAPDGFGTCPECKSDLSEVGIDMSVLVWGDAGMFMERRKADDGRPGWSFNWTGSTEMLWDSQYAMRFACAFCGADLRPEDQAFLVRLTGEELHENPEPKSAD